MVSDVGLIAMSFISLAGMVLLFILNTSTWFKKENFKIKKAAVVGENRIKLKKLEKELGLKGTNLPTGNDSRSTMEVGGDLLGLLKNLNTDQIQGLADKFLPKEEADEGYEERPPDTMTSLLEFANNHPELAESFLKGVTGGKKGETSETNIYES